MNKALFRQYTVVVSSLLVFLAVLVFVMGKPPLMIADGHDNRQLIQPIITLICLTALVWVLMYVYRNMAVIRGIATISYYQTYTKDVPAEWVERPARTFMNLLEVPLLFYVVCLLMLQTDQWDSVQLSLAWLFVASRYLHAIVYIGLNYVPLRLATYMMGCITLAVIWYRFAVAFV
jgi:hypothetical protein